MKFSCEKALLTAAVSIASRAVAAKSSIPAMEGILIEADTRLRLTGYNLETGIQATVPAEIKQPGSLVLSARLFGEIIRKMPDDMVVFTSKDYMVNIKCGMSEFNILGTDPEEFPELPTRGSAELHHAGAVRSALHDCTDPCLLSATMRAAPSTPVPSLRWTTTI